MNKVKLCFLDDGYTKLLFGNILSEDSIFITIKADDGTKFRINKSSIVSIKELEVRKDG